VVVPGLPIPPLPFAPAAAFAQASDAGEEADFTALKSNPTISAVRKFLHEYPLGKHATEAKAILDQQIEKNTWDQAVASNSRDGYESYITLYPNGQFVEEARRRIKDLAVPPKFILHAGTALEGPIMGQPAASSPDQCKAACAADGACKGYDFSYAQRACNLFSDVQGAVRRDDFAAGTIGEVEVKEPPAPAQVEPPADRNPAPDKGAIDVPGLLSNGPSFPLTPKPSPQVSASGFVEVEGMDFPGAAADLYFRRDISYAACQDICRADSRCRAYTYNVVRSACFIKSRIADEVPYPGAISGYVPGTPRPPGADSRGDFDQSPNTDLPGGDIGQAVGVTYDQCLNLCRLNANCQAYTYNVGKMACFIKSGVNFRKPFEGAVSGVRR
jgi:hypothetical protein